MGKISNPEFTGEKLRFLYESVTGRKRVVGNALYYVEEAVGDFEIKNDPISSNPTINSTVEEVKLTTKAPEHVVAPQPVPKPKQPRQASSNTQNSQEVNLNVSTARANLNAIFSSLAGGQK